MRDVPNQDGRTLRVHEGGDPSGRPVIVHHGTPASGGLFAPHVADAGRRGIRLIGYDRPGYGGSTPHPDRTIGDAARDVEAIADALDLERVAVWGVSGGGPHALACAALLGERIAAAASLAGVAPIDAEGLDWTAGMGESNLAEFAATRAGRDALARHLEGELAGVGEVDAASLVELLSSLLSPPDRAALTGELAEYMLASTREALTAGLDGWIDDDLAFDKPWGFDVEEIDVPVLVWHGAQDLFVPVAHGEWLAARIPGVDARIMDGDGHLTITVERVPAVHEWLVERL
jgi:pimeloyl-ACP methyl ester carboxylesterase